MSAPVWAKLYWLRYFLCLTCKYKNKILVLIIIIIIIIHESKLADEFTSQGFFFANVMKFSFTKLNKFWSASQSKLLKNIFNFTIRYINNSLPTRRNLLKWGISATSECSFFSAPESLLHVVAGCHSYRKRFTWRHNSITF